MQDNGLNGAARPDDRRPPGAGHEGTEQARGPRHRGLAMFNGYLLSELEKLAQWFAKANAVPSAVRGKPADIFLILMTGAELGLSPASALRSIHVVEGKPVLAADLMRGIFLKTPGNNIEVIKSDEEACRLLFVRGVRKLEHAWTRDQAESAGLLSKAIWSKYPTEMLLARCTASGLRIIAADLFAGVYSDGELDDVQAPPPATAPPPLNGRPALVEPNAGPAAPLPAAAPKVYPQQPGTETVDVPADEAAPAASTGPLFDREPGSDDGAGDDDPIEGDDDLPPEVALLRGKIVSAKTAGELLPLRREIDKLPAGDHKEQLKATYNEQREKLKGSQP